MKKNAKKLVIYDHNNIIWYIREELDFKNKIIACSSFIYAPKCST